MDETREVWFAVKDLDHLRWAERLLQDIVDLWDEQRNGPGFRKRVPAIVMK